MSSNWRNWFMSSPRERELRDTVALHQQVVEAYKGMPFADSSQLGEFLVELIAEICERRGVAPSRALGAGLWATLKALLYLEGFLLDLPERASLPNLTAEEGIALRATYRHFLRLSADWERLTALWREKLVLTLSGLLEYLPMSAFIDVDEENIGAENAVVLPEAQTLDLCDDLPEALDRLMVSFWDDGIINAHLFDDLRALFQHNLLVASGIPPERSAGAESKTILPSQARNKPPEHLVEAYLQGTPFWYFFHTPLPFAIPFPARFEHTHIVGGTGHGKTQLMQFLINHDLVRALEDRRSVVVIDSQGDLIRNLSQLAYFDPSARDSLADRFVLVDPTDVEHPACLNMFDFNRDRLSGYAPLDREKILNATTEIYEYFFGALLGAELTQRQGVIFKYIARLLMEIPDANIHTLRDLMEDGERFRPYMESLTGTARSFFATRFFDRQFSETKKQILTRLWGVLSNASLERMFSHAHNRVDMFELMNSGKIILINTAKELLGQEGTAIFGRFFIALTAQAAIQRAALPPHERRPAFVYVDEAQDYFDDNISHFLEQTRKYRVGLIFGHQNLDQLTPALRASVLASTTIKFAGGVSAKDANTLDAEYRCDANFLLAQKKYEKQTEFACYVRNYTSRALSVTIPLGYMESLPVIGRAEQQQLLQENRDRYCAPPVLPALATFRTAPPNRDVPEASRVQAPSDSHVEEVPIPAPIEPKPASAIPKQETTLPGRGGRQHKYLQQLIKELAQERGFRASIEESILDNAGRIDVAIYNNDRRVAFEISVTTDADQELANVEKCLAAGYEEVVLVGGTARHVKSLSTFIENNLGEEGRDKVLYLASEELADYFSSLGPSPEPSEQTVRGYRVRTVQQSTGLEDTRDRRKAIAAVIARSLGKTSKSR